MWPYVLVETTFQPNGFDQSGCLMRVIEHSFEVFGRERAILHYCACAGAFKWGLSLTDSSILELRAEAVCGDLSPAPFRGACVPRSYDVISW